MRQLLIVACLVPGAAFAQAPTQTNAIRIDLAKTQGEVHKQGEKLQKTEDDIAKLEDTAILQHMKTKSLNGTVIVMAEEIEGLQQENQMQWGAISILGAGHAVQAKQNSSVEKQADKAEKVNAKQDGQISELGGDVEELQQADKAQEKQIEKVADQITAVATKSAEQIEQVKNETGEKIAEIEAVNDVQQKAIKQNTKTNQKQDEKISKLQASDAAQDSKIKGLKEENQEQDKRLNKHEKQIGIERARNDGQDIKLAGLRNDVDHHSAQIGSLEQDNRDQWASINAHDAMLSDHARKLGELGEGVAMAMSLPDTWLSDLERYAVAGNIATYDGNTAIGFAFVARINTGLSINLKAAATADASQFGASVGARYGW